MYIHNIYKHECRYSLKSVKSVYLVLVRSAYMMLQNCY